MELKYCECVISVIVRCKTPAHGQPENFRDLWLVPYWTLAPNFVGQTRIAVQSAALELRSSSKVSLLRPQALVRFWQLLER